MKDGYSNITLSLENVNIMLQWRETQEAEIKPADSFETFCYLQIMYMIHVGLQQGVAVVQCNAMSSRGPMFDSQWTTEMSVCASVL